MPLLNLYLWYLHSSRRPSSSLPEDLRGRWTHQEGPHSCLLARTRPGRRSGWRPQTPLPRQSPFASCCLPVRPGPRTSCARGGGPEMGARMRARTSSVGPSRLVQVCVCRPLVPQELNQTLHYPDGRPTSTPLTFLTRSRTAEAGSAIRPLETASLDPARRQRPRGRHR